MISSLILYYFWSVLTTMSSQAYLDVDIVSIRELALALLLGWLLAPLVVFMVLVVWIRRCEPKLKQWQYNKNYNRPKR